jgi:aspartate racemase
MTPAIRGELAERKADILALLRQASTFSDIAAPVPVSRQQALPLSFSQQRLWFLAQLEPNNPFYNIPIALRLTGRLNIAALEGSVTEIVRRHEVLRTSFINVGGSPAQVFHEPELIKARMIDLSGKDYDGKHEQAMRLAAEEAKRPFDISKDDLIRLSLLRLNDDDHVALVIMHHIVSDAWSLEILVREVTELYRAYSLGQPSTLPELKLQYADFAAWQRSWLTGQVLEGELKYWRDQMVGAPPTVDLPIDNSRPETQTYRGAEETFILDASTAESLSQISFSERATLFMTLLASFNVLVSRYAQQEDVVVGTPVAGRNQIGAQALIGFFVNTLVLRTRVSPEISFRQLLGRVRDVCLGAYDHQHVPFDHLVDELNPDRSLNRTPLFQVMFMLQNVPAGSLELPGVKLLPLAISHETSKYDLTLSVQESQQYLTCTIRYNADLFHADSIKRMAGHFRVLVEGITANPDERVAALPMLTAPELKQLIIDLNQARADYPSELCLHQLFESQVERTPDAIAVVFEDTHLTYQGLNTRANKLSHYLKRLGVGPDVRVALCLRRSAESLVGLMAILKAGGAYVPIDPSNPPQRIALLIEEADVRVILTEQAVLARLPQSGIRVFSIDSQWGELSKESSLNPCSASSAQSIAYVLYTSGSTGKPKGVMVEHRQVVNYALSYIELTDIIRCSSFALVQPLSVDASVPVIFPSLFMGRCIHIISETRATDPWALAEYFDARNIDCLKIAPSHLSALQTTSHPERIMPGSRLVMGGEGIRWSWIRELQAMAPGCEIFNHYGPTETTVGVLTYKVPSDAESNSYVMTPLSRTTANTQVYILDSQLRPVPTGHVGEIYIGGHAVTRGYLNRPEFTAERFLPDCLGGEPGARLYKSGDLARYLPDCNIEFIGRADQQVKIRAMRIEPGEIESALAQHESVRHCFVRAAPDEKAEIRLVVYIVPAREGENIIPGVKDYLKERLPAHMVPTSYELMDALPLTPHGKVDLRSLPVPGGRVQKSSGEYVPPANEIELLLAGIWQELLDVEHVSTTDNFFDLGGDSLLMVKLVSRMAEALGKQVPVIELFRHPTIATLADYLTDDKMRKMKAAEESQSRNWADNRKALLRRQKQLRQKQAAPDEEAETVGR